MDQSPEGREKGMDVHVAVVAKKIDRWSWFDLIGTGMLSNCDELSSDLRLRSCFEVPISLSTSL